jgi:hypothetical protein
MKGLSKLNKTLQGAEEHASDGSVKKYKARFVARRFPQIEGVVYDKTFDSIVQYTSIRTIIHELETTSDGCKDNLSQMVRLRKKFTSSNQKDS